MFSNICNYPNAYPNAYPTIFCLKNYAPFDLSFLHYFFSVFFCLSFLLAFSVIVLLSSTYRFSFLPLIFSPCFSLLFPAFFYLLIFTITNLWLCSSHKQMQSIISQRIYPRNRPYTRGIWSSPWNGSCTYGEAHLLLLCWLIALVRRYFSRTWLMRRLSEELIYRWRRRRQERMRRW